MPKKKYELPAWIIPFKMWIVAIAAIIVGLSVISAAVYPKINYIWDFLLKTEETNARFERLEKYHKIRSK